MIHYLESSFFHAWLALSRWEQEAMRYPELPQMLKGKRVLVSLQGKALDAPALEALEELIGEAPETKFYVLLDAALPSPQALQKLAEAGCRLGTYLPTDGPSYASTTFGYTAYTNRQIELQRRLHTILGSRKAGHATGTFGLVEPEQVRDPQHFLELIAPYTDKLYRLDDRQNGPICQEVLNGFNAWKEQQG